jgi:hypothetical protein
MKMIGRYIGIIWELMEKRSNAYFVKKMKK